jgi:CRISPR-associated protein Cmr2
MTIQLQDQTEAAQIQVAIAWCLVYSPDSGANTANLKALRQYFYRQQPCGDALTEIVTTVEALDRLDYPGAIADLQAIAENNPELLRHKVGLVYGGATKIKPYVFDLPKLHEIRGASALLDNINLVDLPAFFGADSSDEARFSACRNGRNAEPAYPESVRQWLKGNYPELSDGLIPELIIYSTGGNILAFCPPALVTPLADAIEKRYTTETLIANSCAVGQAFKLLELRCGLLPDTLTNDFRWMDYYQQNAGDTLVQAYLKIKSDTPPVDIDTAFQNRKSFNELTSKLAVMFNQRRAGNDLPDQRSSRRYPVMFETHPYLRRDNAERRSAVLQAEGLPDSPWYSEASAYKRIIGQIAKRKQLPSYQKWYEPLVPKRWQPNWKAESWVKRFEDYLEQDPKNSTYYRGIQPSEVAEAQTVSEIGNASQPDKYIGYIYADGNNMGGYIQGIKTPEEYRQFSQDVSKITLESVYEALAQHLKVHQLKNMTDPESYHPDGTWIHPFEIIAVGGDDVFIIVPADRALQIAQTIGNLFEQKLLELKNGDQYQVTLNRPEERFRPAHLIHRYNPEAASETRSQLSMSIGVLITSEDTPIAYAESLTDQLLKSAKEKAKSLKRPCQHEDTTYQQGYYGGTIDVQVLKSVTMISSKISEFRKNGLVKTYEDSNLYSGESPNTREKPKDLHFYATPYTLHEIDGLIALIQALKAVDFPKSQLYQIRGFLEKGKRTAILNYRYFRVRLKQSPQDLQEPLITWFENSWCKAKENGGNIAPWMYYTELPDPTRKLPDPTRPPKDKLKTYYETIWRELIDLYDFIPKQEIASDSMAASSNAQEVAR